MGGRRCFNAEIGRTRSGHQLVEWAQGEDLRFLLSFTQQGCRDSLFHPKSWTGRHPIIWGATKVLFEEAIGASWSAYTDHNPVGQTG